MAELYRRHQPAIRALAARRAPREGDIADIVNESFLRVFTAIEKGTATIRDFRPYLMATARNVVIEWGRRQREDSTGELPLTGETIGAPADDSVIDKMMLDTAVRSLPGRWQRALWWSEVEARGNTEVGELLGISTGATAALLVRAREGLRSSWLQAHLATGNIDPACQPHVGDLARLQRGKLRGRRRDDLTGHLDQCRGCTELLAHLDDVDRNLPVLLTPIAFLFAAGITTGAGGVASASSGVSSVPGLLGKAAALTVPVKTAAIGAVGVTALVVTLTGFHAGTGGSTVSAPPPATTTIPAGRRAPVTTLPPGPPMQSVPGDPEQPVQTSRTGPSAIPPLDAPAMAEPDPHVTARVAPAPEPEVPADEVTGDDLPQVTASPSTEPDPEPSPAPEPDEPEPAPEPTPTPDPEPSPEPTPVPDPEPGDGVDPTPLIPTPPQVTSGELPEQLWHFPTVSGHAVPGAVVTITDQDGTELAATTAGSSGHGHWRILLDELDAGVATSLSAAQTVNGQTSRPVEVAGTVTVMAPRFADPDGTWYVSREDLDGNGRKDDVAFDLIGGAHSNFQVRLNGEIVTTGTFDRHHRARPVIQVINGDHELSVRYFDDRTGRYGPWESVSLGVHVLPDWWD
ncbi:sigma-70 family RNA polymerase sigma factor [Pseudactinotalea sp. HY160]|uniref:sigma-70 family RNA polymerase sigma factor n=1 Tax=Pseudactinotalea sp. HY160 TaxID=2654490 RepID=UPI001883838D|nr:sigma-70 family RNA polymerase sigma factor [Pseudactinotalea sp. HY160]